MADVPLLPPLETDGSRDYRAGDYLVHEWRRGDRAGRSIVRVVGPLPSPWAPAAPSRRPIFLDGVPLTDDPANDEVRAFVEAAIGGLLPEGQPVDAHISDNEIRFTVRAS